MGKNEEKKKVAFIFDFDETLSEESGQNPYFAHFLENVQKKYGDRFKIEKPEDCWQIYTGDDWAEKIIADIPDVFIGLNNKLLKEKGSDIILSPGADTVVARYTQYCKDLNLDPVYHLISANTRSTIEGTAIFNHFDTVRVGHIKEKDGILYKVDKENPIVTPEDKVKRFKEICKGGDSRDKVKQKDYAVKYPHTFVFGDGLSDLAIFDFNYQAGGMVNALVKRLDWEALWKAEEKMAGSVSLVTWRDFREGSTLDRQVKQNLEMIAKSDCSGYFPLLVHEWAYGKIEDPEIVELVTKHYDKCEFCQSRVLTKVMP